MVLAFYADSVQLSWRVCLFRIKFPCEVLFAFRSFGFNNDVRTFGSDVGFQFYLSQSSTDASGSLRIPQIQSHISGLYFTCGMQKEIADKKTAPTVDVVIFGTMIVHHTVVDVYSYGIFIGFFTNISSHATVSHKRGFVPCLGQTGPYHVLFRHKVFPICLAIAANNDAPYCNK